MSSTHSPRSSTDTESPPSSPIRVSGLSGTNSASRLVLLPDTDLRDPLEEYTTDEEDENEDGDSQLGINQLPIPPLSHSAVFLYLLSPYLRLGAIYALEFGDASLPTGLTGLIVAVCLSAFCRQIWFLLGRYLRKSSTEDILTHAFARRYRRTLRYGLIRSTFAVISGLFKLLLAAMYLRDSVDSALLVKGSESNLSRSRVNISIIMSILVFVLSLPKSLASRSIMYTTSLSVVSYLVWLVAVSRSHGANELSLPSLSLPRRGVLWNEISSLTFACATTMTVPLSASLVAGTLPVSTASRDARASSFQRLNMSSAILAALLMLPLVIIAASPRAPSSAAASDDLVLCFRITTLVLSIPSVVVSITSLPLHGVVYRLIRTNTALSIITLVILALSMVPSDTVGVLDDVVLFLAVSGTFLLPALAHIIIHYFRRPLSIVIPQALPSAPNTLQSSISEPPPSPSRDSLLQRKEWLLQRSRLGKRLFWDFVIWVVLIPICGCAFVWVAGQLAGQW